MQREACQCWNCRMRPTHGARPCTTATAASTARAALACRSKHNKPAKEVFHLRSQSCGQLLHAQAPQKHASGAPPQWLSSPHCSDRRWWWGCYRVASAARSGGAAASCWAAPRAGPAPACLAPQALMARWDCRLPLQPDWHWQGPAAQLASRLPAHRQLLCHHASPAAMSCGARCPGMQALRMWPDLSPSRSPDAILAARSIRCLWI